jgi:hypothetical protein
MARKTGETKSKAMVTPPDSNASISESGHKARTSREYTEASRETGQEELAASISIQEKVALLAYSYWEKREGQGGSPEEDWYRAEKEILGQLGVYER